MAEILGIGVGKYLILALQEELSVVIPDESIDEMLNIDMIFSVFKKLNLNNEKLMG